MKSILITAAVLLVLPATAHSAPAVVQPIGATACAADGTCMVTASTDTYLLQTQRVVNNAAPYDVAGGVVITPSGQYQWGSAGCTGVNLPGVPPTGGNCTLVPGIYVTWRAQRFHKYRTSEDYYSAIVWRYYPIRDGAPVMNGSVPDVLTHRPQFNTPDCNPTGDNAAWFLSPRDAAGVQHPTMKPTDLAPDDFAAACGGREGTDPPTVDPPAEEPPVTEDALKNCPAIKLGKKKVAVKSRGANCGHGRNIMARWLRRGVEPEGWLCVTAKAGRARAATCAKLSTGRSGKAAGPRITGRWRA